MGPMEHHWLELTHKLHEQGWSWIVGHDEQGCFCRAWREDAQKAGIKYQFERYAPNFNNAVSNVVE